MRIAFLFIIALVTSGCSNRAVYENMQMYERNKCSNVPLSEYNECMEATRKPYDEYEREYNDSAND